MTARWYRERIRERLAPARAALRHGDTLVFPSHFTKPDGARVDLRAVWMRVGSDAYRAESSELANGEWRTQFAIVYRRDDEDGR